MERFGVVLYGFIWLVKMDDIVVIFKTIFIKITIVIPWYRFLRHYLVHRLALVLDKQLVHFTFLNSIDQSFHTSYCN